MAKPINYYTSFTLVGIGHFCTASILPCSTDTPSAEITCPKNSTCSRNSAHFVSLMYNLFFWRSANTSLSNCTCSSYVREYISISSRYTSTPRLSSLKNTSLITRWKVPGVLVKPNGITNHSKVPYLHVKAVNGTLSSETGI